MQTLEGSLVGQEKGLSVQDPAQDSQPTRLPAHIREIVTRNLSQPESSGTPGLSPPQALPTSQLSYTCLSNSHNDKDRSFHFLNAHCQAGTAPPCKDPFYR